MHYTKLPYYRVIDNFLNGEPGSSHTSPYTDSPRLVSDGVELRSYDTCVVARNHGRWYIDGKWIKILGLNTSAPTSTSRRHISRTWDRIRGDEDTFLFRYPTNEFKTLKEAAQFVDRTGFEDVTHWVLRHSRAQREYRKRSIWNALERRLQQWEFAQWVLGYSNEFPSTQVEWSHDIMYFKFEVMLNLCDLASQTLNLPIKINASLPTLRQRVRKLSLQKELTGSAKDTSGSPEEMVSLPNANMTSTNTSAQTATAG